MAGFLLCATRFLFLFLINFIFVSCGPANKLVQNVPAPLIRSALQSLDQDSPTHHTYKGGNLISAQKLEELPYVIYRLTFDLTPICKETLEPCPREACTVEVKQHEQGDITVLRESIQCMYLYPQSTQDDPLQVQENNQEQEMIENLDKQVIGNQSVELDHEIQNTRDHNEKPFIAMRASDPKYCPGCPYELNPNLPGWAVFGEQVARSMDESIQNDFKHKVINIVKVTRAVPPSSNIIQYQILLNVGESDCLKNAIDQSQCFVQEGLPVKTCLVTFERQPWRQSGQTITKNNCTVGNTLEFEDALVSQVTIARTEALVAPNSNREESNIEKVEALENLKHILDNYTYATVANLGGQEQLEVTEHPVVRVTVNRDKDDTVSQKFEDKAKEFNEFLQNFDLPVRETKSNPEVNREEIREEVILPKRVSSANSITDESRSIYRRERSVLGGPSSKNIDDPEIQELANKGLQKFSENYRGTNEPIIIEIVEASEQVVSGSLYKIKVRLGTSTCPKGTTNNCQLQEGSQVQLCEFRIWSQPWIDKGSPEITTRCDPEAQPEAHTRKTRSVSRMHDELRKKRSNLVGSPTSRNVDDLEIQELANKGLRKFSENYRGTNEPIIAEIVEASEQIVSGSLYKIKVKLGTSTCPKGTTNNCQLQEGSQVQLCEFRIWSQPWIDKGSPEITTRCDPEAQPEAHTRKTRSVSRMHDELRKKRSNLVGSPTSRNVDDLEIQELANKGLRKFSENYRGTNEPIIAEIVEASEQIVSGSLYKIKVKLGTSTCPKGTTNNCQLQEGSQVQLCEFRIWSQPWIDEGSPEITIRCDPEAQPEAYTRKTRSVSRMHDELRKKRSNLVGSPTSRNVDDLEIQELANKGLRKFSENYRGTNEPIIAEIVEASEQIVSGSLYKIKVKLGTSTCPKGTTNNCQLQEGSQVQLCEFRIWSQPWIDEGSPEITIRCDPEAQPEAHTRKTRSVSRMHDELRKKRSDLVGSPTSRSVDDLEIQELAKKGLQKFSENSEGMSEPIIAEIVEASEQVVAGSLYKIKVKLGTSTCPKGTTDNCQLQEGSEIKECLFTIWSRPWMDNGRPEITINCDVNNQRKRSLRGNQYSQTMLKLAADIKKENLFNDFMKDYDKTYSSHEEKQERFKIFKKNLQIIEDLQKAELGTAIYGVTMFADLTPKEFKARYLGFRPELRHENEIPLLQAEIPDVELPPKFDWRERGVVTPVKDQSQCGSCWAFSVTGNVEGQYAIKHGKLLSLSEQELVDCDTLDEGCNGGEMVNGYKAIERLGGLELEKDYPYDARDETCHFDESKARVQVVNAVNITSNETQIAQWLVQNGPISIAINANAMQFYVGGVSHPFKFLCNPKDLDHGVLLVGYGMSKYPLFHKELPYWIIKNSWGPRWGEKGYYRVYRGDGTCGVNTQASSAIVA